MILLYHRISTIKHDPHQLIVSPENFKCHLQMLSRRFNVVTLDEKIEQIKRGDLHQSVAITFDDGYMDNYTQALPVLRDVNVPATVFVTAGAIQRQCRFAWDDDSVYNSVLGYRQLYYLSRDRLIEIGSHAVSHISLSTLTLQEQYYELGQSKLWLENVMCIDIRYLSYPFGSYGDFTAETKQVAQTVGYKAALANTQENVNSDLFAMPRRIVRNWDVGSFEERIDSWIK